MELNKETRELIDKAINKQELLYLTASNIPVTFQTCVLAQNNNHFIIRNTISPSYINSAVKSKNFFLQVYSYKFQCDRIESDGENILFPIGRATLLQDARQEQRFTFPNWKKATCNIKNPYDSETILSKPVLDLSVSGVSISSSYQSELLSPNTHLREIKILINEDHYLSYSGDVIYKRKLVDINKENSFQIGIKFC